MAITAEKALDGKSDAAMAARDAMNAEHCPFSSPLKRGGLMGISLSTSC